MKVRIHRRAVELKGQKSLPKETYNVTGVTIYFQLYGQTLP